MVITITITPKGGATREIVVDSDDITLGFQEDMQRFQESGKIAVFRSALQAFLGITEDEARALTARQIREIGTAMNAAGESPVPNG